MRESARERTQSSGDGGRNRNGDYRYAPRGKKKKKSRRTTTEVQERRIHYAARVCALAALTMPAVVVNALGIFRRRRVRSGVNNHYALHTYAAALRAFCYFSLSAHYSRFSEVFFFFENRTRAHTPTPLALRGVSDFSTFFR